MEGVKVARIDVFEDYGVSRSKNLARRGFGRERGNSVLLHPVEVAYLSTKGCSVYLNEKKLNITEILKWCFKKKENTLLFFVFSDLRNRGRKIKVEENFIVGNEIFVPISERDFVDFREIVGRKFNLAIVDEEGDVTYYKHSEWNCVGRHRENIKPFDGVFAGDRVLTCNKEIFEKFFYGSMNDGIVNLSLVEAVYLAEKGLLKLDVSNEKLKYTARQMEKKFEERYAVYRDLKDRGFVVKTGFKFGSDFRVYEKVENLRDLPHSKYLVKVAERIRASELASHVRVARAVRKKMVFCFDIKGLRYICIERIKV
ncbi:MAG: tRNA-intron lyase [Archaeoglobus sp.]|nr:MAG: tRNA-intron lyase [Archaeoglobus sp.]